MILHRVPSPSARKQEEQVPPSVTFPRGDMEAPWFCGFLEQEWDYW